MAIHWPIKAPLISGVLLGSATGVFFRLLTELPRFGSNAGATMLMTAAFLVLGPITIGYITLKEAEQLEARPVWQWITVPWLPILLIALITYVLNLEGLICVVFGLPIAMAASSFGGIIAGVEARRNRKRQRITLACFALIPMIVALLEMRVPAPRQMRTVETQIDIHASPQTVWSNIEQVKAIAPGELRPTWTHAIGFPRPIAATFPIKAWEVFAMLRLSGDWCSLKKLPPGTLSGS